MKKILFCTPFKQSKEYVQGGIAVWGANIINYANALNISDINLIPVSFDRKHYIYEGQGLLMRVYRGARELIVPIKEVYFHLKNSRPDCIHLCTSASLSLLKDILILFLAKKFGVRSIIHLHFGRISDIFLKGGWENILLNKVLKLSNVIVTMNEESYKSIISHGFSNVYNLPNPISLDVIEKIRKLDFKLERIPNRLLYVGHVTRTKGVWELVEACSKIDGIELRIVGRITEEHKTELRKIAGDESYKWCHFIGEVSHDQVLEELMMAGLFVFPSYTEGFPNVILEAMACGCPIASSNVGAIPEMLNINIDPCGLCYKPQSVDEIKKTINFIIFDEIKKTEFANKAKQRVHENYVLPIIWEKLLNIWEVK